MSQPTYNRLAEGEWARGRLRDYLLQRLDDGAEERFHVALPLVQDLSDDLRDAEEKLIDGWLEETLGAEDRKDFERCYVEGTEANRIKLEVYRAIRLAEPISKPEMSPAPVLSLPRGRQSFLVAGVIAASVIAGILAFLGYGQWRENLQLKAELKKTLPGDSGIGPVEQPAGVNPDGFVLSRADSGKTFLATEAPARILWTNVPNYQAKYKIRVSPATGREQTSPLLEPKDDAVGFTLDNPAALAWPWEISILDADGTILAHYRMVKK